MGFVDVFLLYFHQRITQTIMFVRFPPTLVSFLLLHFFCIISPVVGYYAESNSFLYLETKSVDELDYMFNRAMGNPLFCAVMSPVL